MKRVAASFMAMAAGWGVMNVGLFLVLVVSGGISLGRSGPVGIISGYSPWFVISALVVGAAWLVVYLPVYALVPRASCFWNWRFCVPCGAVVGALVPFGFWVIPSALHDGSLGRLVFLLLPATVGAVAALVGRWLVDWSRNYEEMRVHGELERALRDSLDWEREAVSPDR